MNAVDSIRLAISGRTDIGKVREENEDNIQWSVHAHQPFGYVAIADGMGGYSGGALASTIAVDSVKQYMDQVINTTFMSCTPDQQTLMIQATLIDSIKYANQKILEAKLTRPQMAQMGTTIVVAVVWKQNVMVAHLGDSRAYLWDAQGLVQLTKDHSLVQEMIDSGSLTPEEAKNSNVRNHITRALGVTQGVEPQLSCFTLERNALLMLCSDGLTEYLSDPDLEYVLATHRPALECCYRFIDDANRLGGKDNISVGLVEFTLESAPAPLDITIPPGSSSPEEDITVRKEQRS